MRLNNITQRIGQRKHFFSFGEIERIIKSREEKIYRMGFNDGMKQANLEHKELLKLCRKEQMNNSKLKGGNKI